MDMMAIRRKVIEASKLGPLPTGYRKIDWLEGNGSQYIDSGIECTGDLCVAFKCRVLEDVNAACCGGIDLRNSPVYFRHHHSPNSLNIYWIQNNNTNRASVASDNIDKINTDIEIVINPVSGTAKVNGTNFTFTPLSGSLTTTKNYGIFSRIANNGTVQSRKSRFYYFKFFRDNQEIGNFIPCIRTLDSKPGMYDTVSGTFFTNAGTGEFVIPS